MLVKFMGLADVRLIGQGDTFDGRLPGGTSVELRWERSNHWVVDTDEVGLNTEAVALLLEEPGFLDVTGLEVVPSNENQKMFSGHPEPVVLEDEVAPVALEEVSEEGAGTPRPRRRGES